MTRFLRLVTAVVVVVAVGASAAALGPSDAGTAWVDTPLDGAVVAATVGVVGHATDPDGVVEVRLDVDGSTVATVGTDGSTLVTVAFTWTPDTAGTFGISVWGRDPGGSWSTPGVATVTVLAGPVPGDTTTTTTTTATTTTATTTTGTTSPTTSPSTTVPPPTTTVPVCDPPPLPPTLGSPDDGAAVAPATGATLTWSYGGCGVVVHRVQLALRPSFTDLLFDVAVGAATSHPTGPLTACRDYFWRVQASLDGVPGPWSATRTFTTPSRTPCP